MKKLIKNVIFSDFIEQNIKNKLLSIESSNLVNDIWIYPSKIYEFNGSYFLVKNFTKKVDSYFNYFVYDHSYKGFKYKLGLLELSLNKDNEYFEIKN